MTWAEYIDEIIQVNVSVAKYDEGFIATLESYTDSSDFSIESLTLAVADTPEQACIKEPTHSKTQVNVNTGKVKSLEDIREELRQE